MHLFVQFWNTPHLYGIFLSLNSSLIKSRVSIQKRALKIALPQSSYTTSLRNTGLLTLYQRRENQCLSFYKNIHQHSDDKLRTLLPSAISHKFSLRNKRTYRSYPMYKCKTERYKNSFIPKCVRNWDRP